MFWWIKLTTYNVKYIVTWWWKPFPFYSMYWQTNHKLLYVVRYCTPMHACSILFSNMQKHCDEQAHAWVMEWTVKHSLMSRLPMIYTLYIQILQKYDKMAVITGNITLLAKVKKLIHGQGNKALIAATSDRLASHPTKDGRTTDSCFTHIGAHQCGIRMVVGWRLE